MKKQNLRQIAFLGMGAALTVALIYLIRVPMFLPFLEYDPGDIPIYFCTFILGPIPGFILTVVASIIQGLTVSAASGWIGIIMHIFATGSFTLVAGYIYFRKKTTARLFLGSAAGLVVTVVTMAAWNLLLTPVFMNAPVSAVIQLLPAITAFNIIKVSINAGVSIIIYKALYKFIKI
ncbi:MAG: ECF transporter S component [Eubacteriales bacterium]